MKRRRYRIRKVTPNMPRGFIVGCNMGYQEAKNRLKGIKADIEQDFRDDPPDADRMPYLHNQNRNLVTWNGADRIEYATEIYYETRTS